MGAAGETGGSEGTSRLRATGQRIRARLRLVRVEIVDDELVGEESGAGARDAAERSDGKAAPQSTPSSLFPHQSRARRPETIVDRTRHCMLSASTARRNRSTSASHLHVHSLCLDHIFDRVLHERCTPVAHTGESTSGERDTLGSLCRVSPCRQQQTTSAFEGAVPAHTTARAHTAARVRE